MNETKSIIEKISEFHMRQSEIKLDSTELGQLIVALRHAEEKSAVLTSIVESTDDAIISKDLNSIVTSWNTAATRIFGYSADEMVGQSILKIIPIERHDEEPQILAQLRQGIRVDHFETERLRKDGVLINVSLTISPLKDGAGKVVGLSKIARDITDKKLIEKNKDEFVSFVSHELKTPLTSLKSYIQVARQKSADPEFVSNTLSRAELQINKMENMIRDFLNISRVEDGLMKIEKSPFDISELISECVADARMTSINHEVKYSPVPSTWINGDREKISMVLTNLISNAQKYSPDGGEINVSCEQLQGKVRIKVSDQGLGISAENQKNMFKKFHRVESEQTKHIPGFGIGLYLASIILKFHHSTFELESQVGKGSTFLFELS